MPGPVVFFFFFLLTNRRTIPYKYIGSPGSPPMTVVAGTDQQRPAVWSPGSGPLHNIKNVLSVPTLP